MDGDRYSRPLSDDLQHSDLRPSDPSLYSNQVQTYPRESWREPNMAFQYPSGPSSYRHHPSSWPPSSSSSPSSSFGRETRFPLPSSGRSSYLAPPPLAPYVAPSTGRFVPPFHEQPLNSDDRHPTLRVDGHSSAFVQRPSPEHGATAAEGGSHSLPPLRSASGSYSYENTAYSPRTGEAYSSSQKPTMTQFSKLTTGEQEKVNAGLPPPHEVEVSPQGCQSELVTSSASERTRTGRTRPDSLANTANQSIQQAPATFSSYCRRTKSRSLSQSSQPSQNSRLSHQSRRSSHSQAEPMSREYSVSSNESSHAAGSAAPSEDLYSKKAPLPGKRRGREKKKRTRALMTHLQQAGLMRLWKKVISKMCNLFTQLITVNQTKFPTSGDREALGQEIGLTSRQVQVWFQVGVIRSFP